MKRQKTLIIILFLYLNLSKFKLIISFKVKNRPDLSEDPLPGCESFNNEICKTENQYHANDNVENRRWQTPRPGDDKYQESFQDYHSLVGFSDINYLNQARDKALVCINAIHKFQNNISLSYFFDNNPHNSNCKLFDSSYKNDLKLSVKASDNTQLYIDPVIFIWNNPNIMPRAGDYRNGQKGAIIELFGWKYIDVQKECELISKSGYLGIKLTPVHEQLMSSKSASNTINPWYYMYQPVSYRLNGRFGTREALLNLINTCRSLGVRIYVDVVINHFTGTGNDLNDHRDSSSECLKWGNKTSSAPFDRQSPFYTHGFTYKVNSNTRQPPSNEFPAAAIGPEDFHCERSLNSWDDLFILNNGWLVGLTDLDTSKDNVRERLASYLVELLSIGVSGFRIDAAKHISPEDLSAILKKIQIKMGGQLPEDFVTWLEILTGGEAYLLWDGPSWYGNQFNKYLLRDLGSETELNKIKIFDGLYPNRPWENSVISKNRIVIQNDDHDLQAPGFTRDIEPNGCVLVKNCSIDRHRYFETKLFDNPNGVGNNSEDWPIRIVLSSYYFTYGFYGIPDGLSLCDNCLVNCQDCKENVPFIEAYSSDACGYSGNGYTRVHRDISIINSMRKWIGLGPIKGADIGLENCF